MMVIGSWAGVKLEGEYWVVVCGVVTSIASFYAIFDATHFFI